MDSVQVFWWLVLMGGWFFLLAAGGAIVEAYFAWERWRKRRRRGEVEL